MTTSSTPAGTPEVEPVGASQAPAPGKEAESALLSGGLLQSLLKWSAVLFTLGGLSLHVTGYIYHSELLGAWGLDADLFPKSVEWILIHGYYVTLAQAVKLWIFFKAAWWKFVAFGVVVTFLSTANICIQLSKDGKQAIARFRSWARSRRLWMLASVVSFVVAAGASMAIAFAPILFATLIILPASMAVSEAKSQVATDRSRYEQGCSDTDSERRCLTLRREGKPDLRGFLIDSSESVLAIYLPERKAIQIVPREGVELELLVGRAVTATGRQSSSASSHP